MFWATVVLVLLTMLATAYNYLLFRGTIDPNVIVYPALQKEQPSLILLVIENIGKGVAKNIKFRFSKPLLQTFGISDAEVEAGTPVTSGAFITGIPALAPGQRREIIWGQYGGIRRTIRAGEVLSITATYEADAVGPIQPREFVTESFAEVDSFLKNPIGPEDPLKLVADELKLIRSLLERRVG